MGIIKNAVSNRYPGSSQCQRANSITIEQQSAQPFFWLLAIRDIGQITLSKLNISRCLRKWIEGKGCEQMHNSQ